MSGQAESRGIGLAAAWTSEAVRSHFVTATLNQGHVFLMLNPTLLGEKCHILKPHPFIQEAMLHQKRPIDSINSAIPEPWGGLSRKQAGGQFIRLC